MKNNPITVGFDDATFELKHNIKTTQLIGVVCQGIRMVNVVRSEIMIDGIDATEKLISLVKQQAEHVQYILTHTITFGGFNLINLDQIYNELVLESKNRFRHGRHNHSTCEKLKILVWITQPDALSAMAR